MSKTYSMPGWRIGFAAGNPHLIAALARNKSYLDYGAFTPIQVAAAAALNGPQECVDEIRERYRNRRDVLIEGLHSRPVGMCRARRRPCSPGRRFPNPSNISDRLEFSKLLLREANVAVSPGVGFGEHGDGSVRLALVENEHRTRQAIRSIKAFLCQSELGARGFRKDNAKAKR